MPQQSVVSDHRWVILEAELRSVLDDHDVDPALWLVHDLLVAIREAVTAENLTTYKIARKYYNAFPAALNPITPSQPSSDDQELVS